MSQAPPQLGQTTPQFQPGTVVIPNVTWRDYSRFLKLFEDRPGYRLTYDQGVLEIMSPLFQHDNDAELLGVFVGVMTKELNLPIRRGGSTTLRRRKKQRGLEPDRCYWIANASKIAGRRRIDLKVDPAPDLVIEVDVTNSSLDRMSIYARLGVVELWNLSDDVLTFYRLQPSGGYTVLSNSIAFPFLTPSDLLPFLQDLKQTDDENVVEENFLTWLRQRLAQKP